MGKHSKSDEELLRTSVASLKAIGAFYDRIGLLFAAAHVAAALDSVQRAQEELGSIGVDTSVTTDCCKVLAFQR